jgi:hypothetical protein
MIYFSIFVSLYQYFSHCLNDIACQESMFLARHGNSSRTYYMYVNPYILLVSYYIA